MTPEALNAVREDLRILLREKGPGVLIELLTDGIKQDHSQWVAREAIRLLSQKNDPSWPTELTSILLVTPDEAVLHSGLHFELETLLRKDENSARDQITSRVREALSSNDLKVRLRAARIVGSLGFRYEGCVDDLRALLDDPNVSKEDQPSLLNTAASMGAVNAAELQKRIDDLIEANVTATRSICVLLGWHGSERHFTFLRSIATGTNLREALTGMLLMAGRIPSIGEEVAKAFLASPRTDRFGLEHYAYRYLDSVDIVAEFWRLSLAHLAHDSSQLVDVNLVMNCNRPAHLECLGRIREGLSEAQLDILGTIIKRPTGYKGIYATHETYLKENALKLATRLGLPQLREWIVDGIEVETTPFLISRFAEDCIFWKAGDFAQRLVGRMQSRSNENPLWLIADEAGAAGGEVTIKALLESDGRVTRSDAEEALNSYCLGLAYAALNAKSTQPLVDAMMDASSPIWRREAVAYAVRQVSILGGDHLIDWQNVANYITESKVSEFSRDELLISLASASPAIARPIIESLPDRARGRILLAAVICETQISEVLQIMERYASPPTSPYSHGFELAYGAVTLARLYDKGLIATAQVCTYLIAGLQHEVDQFCRSCREIRDGDDVLCDVIWNAVKEHNTSWQSHPGLWADFGRLCPELLVDARVIAHLAECNSQGIYGFLDALIDQRERLTKHSEVIWNLLVELAGMKDRSVQWYAAFAASLFAPDLAAEWIASKTSLTDQERRWKLEVALWLPDEVWDRSCEEAQAAIWADVRDYVPTLSEVRASLRWADQYWDSVRESGDLLSDWKYVQALFRLPSERVALAAQELRLEGIGRNYWRRWFGEKLQEKIKKNRPKLWQDSQLPDEEPFPRSPL
jgi:hypothetical protein